MACELNRHLWKREKKITLQASSSAVWVSLLRSPSMPSFCAAIFMRWRGLKFSHIWGKKVEKQNLNSQCNLRPTEAVCCALTTEDAMAFLFNGSSPRRQTLSIWLAHFRDKLWDWREGSVVKSTCSSCKDLSSAASTHMVAHNHL